MHIGSVRGLPSPSPASSCCLTQIETETLPSFFLCLMRVFLSLQLTASSNLTMSHIQGSNGIAFKSAPCVSVHVACMFLCEWTCVRGRAGNGRMKWWQRAVTPTPRACLCCSVNLSHQCVEEWLTVRLVSQVGLRYCCVVHFVPGQLCTLGTERTYAVMAWFFLGDWGAFAALLPQQVMFWGVCVCVSYRMTSSTVSDLSSRLVNPITYVQRHCLSHWIYPALLLKPVISSTHWFLHILQ